MASDDFGRDLASVQALLRKHEGLERDLAALEDKVSLSVRFRLTSRQNGFIHIHSCHCLTCCMWSGEHFGWRSRASAADSPTERLSDPTQER